MVLDVCFGIYFETMKMSDFHLINVIWVAVMLLFSADCSLMETSSSQISQEAIITQSNMMPNERNVTIDELSLSNREQVTVSVPRTIVRSGKLNMFRFGLSNNKMRISPLYLINGTVCRFINLQPICTTLSTTGLIRGPTSGGGGGGGSSGGSRGGGSSGGSSGGGSSGGSRGGSSGGGSSGGGGGSSGGSSGGSGGQRPSSSGVQSGFGSSVQFVEQPSRLDDESPDLPVENSESGPATSAAFQGPQTSSVVVPRPPMPLQPLNLVVHRRPFTGLFPFKRPQYQLSANRQEQDTANHRQDKTKKN